MASKSDPLVIGEIIQLLEGYHSKRVRRIQQLQEEFESEEKLASSEQQAIINYRAMYQRVIAEAKPANEHPRLQGQSESQMETKAPIPEPDDHKKTNRTNFKFLLEAPIVFHDQDNRWALFGCNICGANVNKDDEFFNPSSLLNHILSHDFNPLPLDVLQPRDNQDFAYLSKYCKVEELSSAQIKDIKHGKKFIGKSRCTKNDWAPS